jgi:ribosomal protein S18 acetylase RimI-like enzyme
MIHISRLTRPDLMLRWMVHLDLPQVVRISEQAAGFQWQREDFLQALRAVDTVGHVAENAHGVAGFLIYKIQRETEDFDPDEGGWLPSRLAQRLNPPVRRQLQIDLLNIGVAPECQRQGIGRALLAKLCLKIHREPGGIRALVPETNLPALLFLRDFGFKATRVVRDYYPGADAYRMERWAE